MVEMPCFNILEVKHFWFSFGNDFPFIFFIILCAINMTQNQGKLRHDMSVCEKWTVLNYLKGHYFFFFFLFLISSAENSDISWIYSDWAFGPISKSTGKWDFYPPQNLRGHEGSVILPQTSHGAATLRSYSAKVKISYDRDTKPWEEGERHDLKMSSYMWLCPLATDFHTAAGI